MGASPISCHIYEKTWARRPCHVKSPRHHEQAPPPEDWCPVRRSWSASNTAVSSRGHDVTNPIDTFCGGIAHGCDTFIGLRIEAAHAAIGGVGGVYLWRSAHRDGAGDV